MEVDDFERFKRQMSESQDAQRWESQMAPIMEQAVQADTGFHDVLSEVFHLD
jgi:L-rhamnose mutarotase